VAANPDVSTSTYWSHGAAYVVAGEELLAHGRPLAAARLLRAGEAWLRRQLAITPDERVHRYWLGSVLYDLERWPEAAAVLRELARDHPERLPYRGPPAGRAARAGDRRGESRPGGGAAPARG